MTRIHHARSSQLRKSLKARTNAERKFSERAADWMTSQFGSVLFLVANLVFFVIWIMGNVGVFGSSEVIDPYPFGLLTLVVSLEAIVLSIVVIISQNRQARVADLREEVDFYINLVAEREVTKILSLLGMLLKKQGVDLTNDPEVKKMMEPISAEEIEEQFKKEMEEGG
jgi:uncharacterized membrane protein